LIIP